MNLALCRSLTPEQRARTFTHPEHGPVTVEWVMTFFAGHERHHLPQLEAIGVDEASGLRASGPQADLQVGARLRPETALSLSLT